MKFFFLLIFMFSLNLNESVNSPGYKLNRSIAFLKKDQRQKFTDTLVNLNNIQATSQQNDPEITVLIDLREKIKSWAFKCTLPGHENQMSLAYGKCGQGDMAIFSGIACLGAVLGEDEQTALQRCGDVSRAQGSNGRWWRGPIYVDTTDPEKSKNSFSRDQGLGVQSLIVASLVAKTKNPFLVDVKSKIKKWLLWIETDGKGQMCTSSTSNLCKINGMWGSSLYDLVVSLGLDQDDDIKDTDVFRKLRNLKRNYKNVFFQSEVEFLKPDYGLHLATINNLLFRLNGRRKVDSIKDISEKIYNKDPHNPFYELLFKGASSSLISSILNKCSPTVLMAPSGLPWYSYDWSWQRDSRTQPWLKSFGHDCIFLINMVLAEKKGNLLPFKKLSPKKSCPFNTTSLDLHNDLPVCVPIPSTPISSGKCTGKGQLEWSHSSGRYCLIDEESWYRARIINKPCPGFREELGEYLGLPLCKANPDVGIPISDCLSGQNTTLAPDKKSCYFNERTWYLSKRISSQCPGFREYLGNYPYWEWPICKALPHTAIEESECVEGTYVRKHNGYCLFNKKGWFLARKLKSSFCTGGRKKLEFKFNEKIVCKALPHFAIQEHKCDGSKSNQHCLWDQGEWVLAREMVEDRCPEMREKIGTNNDKIVCKALPHFSIKKKNCDGAEWNNFCVWDKGYWYLARELK